MKIRRCQIGVKSGKCNNVVALNFQETEGHEQRMAGPSRRGRAGSALPAASDNVFSSLKEHLSFTK